MNPEIKAKIPILATPEKFPFVTEIIHQNPPIIKIKKVLTHEECQHIINLAKPKLQSSTMVIKDKEVVGTGRTSKSAFLTSNGKPTEDKVMKRYLNRLSQFCGKSIPHFEGLKVVNYAKGQEYKGHYDYFKDKEGFLKPAGDRQYTFFTYLNDMSKEQGGSTSFPKLNITNEAEYGDVMFWVNLHDGHYFEETLHSGDPVLTDREKWGINVWIREQEYP